VLIARTVREAPAPIMFMSSGEPKHAATAILASPPLAAAMSETRSPAELPIAITVRPRMEVEIPGEGGGGGCRTGEGRLEPPRKLCQRNCQRNSSLSSFLGNFPDLAVNLFGFERIRPFLPQNSGATGGVGKDGGGVEGLGRREGRGDIGCGMADDGCEGGRSRYPFPNFVAPAFADFLHLCGEKNLFSRGLYPLRSLPSR
jgi:hypothetical protein